MRGILVDENGELMIRNGSMVIGDCRADIVERLVVAFPGEFKQAPLLGGALRKEINGVVDAAWGLDVKKQLRSEGVDVRGIRVNEIGIQVELND
ncbi:MAG: hypothetical protein LBU51_03170 [Bacteroidales bacterium]|jgi:hypothetical protein|nr:hypothetical protein [Bacteroidales bacterium]